MCILYIPLDAFCFYDWNNIRVYDNNNRRKNHRLSQKKPVNNIWQIREGRNDKNSGA